MKKIVWILCLAMLFSCIASCSSKPISSNESGNDITSSEISNETANTENIFSLPYFSNDSLNPYSAKQSVNFYMGTLVYEPLFRLDNSFNPIPIIAENYELNDKKCIVTLKKGLKFSDGSSISAADVASSFKTAKKSSLYSQRLSNAKSCTAKGNTVVFNLNAMDIHFAKNLNFPVIKGGSSKSLAVGSGRYKFSETTPLSLVKNELSTRKSSKINNISLVEIHKYSTLPYMVKIGSVNYVYATSKHFDLKTAASKTTQVITNNLIYLGINSENPYLANQDIRKAISLLINRKSILTDAFANGGYATAAPFNPKNKDLNSKDYAFDLTNTSAAAELLTVAGLIKDKNGKFIDAEEMPITLRICVNKSNNAKVRAAQSIKLSLDAAGFTTEIIEHKDADFRESVSKGDYDLFIGETKLTPDNDISQLLSKDTLNLCDDGGETLEAYNKHLRGEIALSDFLRIFDLKTPFIPIMYNNGTVVSSGTLSGNGVVTEYDIFADMDKWVF